MRHLRIGMLAEGGGRGGNARPRGGGFLLNRSGHGFKGRVERRMTWRWPTPARRQSLCRTLCSLGAIEGLLQQVCIDLTAEVDEPIRGVAIHREGGVIEPVAHPEAIEK